MEVMNHLVNWGNKNCPRSILPSPLCEFWTMNAREHGARHVGISHRPRLLFVAFNGFTPSPSSLRSRSWGVFYKVIFKNMLKWKETFLSRSFPNSTIFGHGSHKGNKWDWSIRFEHMSISNAGYISNSTLAVLIVLTEQPSNATHARLIWLSQHHLRARAHTAVCENLSGHLWNLCCLAK